MNFKELREKYPKFIYEKYEIEESVDKYKFTFHFSVPGLTEYKPYIKIKKVVKL